MQFLVSLRFNYSRAFNIRLQQEAWADNPQDDSRILRHRLYNLFLFFANVSLVSFMPALLLSYIIYNKVWRTDRGDVSRKEVFQPHLPVRLPCYDLAPITSFTLGRSSRSRTSGAPGFHGLTGGVYKARERIHRAMADARLLANPASWGRVADPNPN